MNNLSKPLVSIIVPFLEADDALYSCLKALSEQDYPREQFEVLLIHNDAETGSNFPEPSLNAKLPLKILHEPQSGVAFARNLGLENANGEIIAFTDADCYPQQNWLSEGVRQLQNSGESAMLAGKITITTRKAAQPKIAEMFELLFAFDQEKYIEQFNFGVTANLFSNREVFRVVGNFNTEMLSGTDMEWGRRVFAAGFKQVYSPQVCVAHPARYRLKELLKKQRRVVGGVHQMQLSKGYPFTLFLIHLLLDWPGLKDLLNVFQDRRIKGIAWRFKILGVLLLIKMIRLTERIRLWFGGTAKWWDNTVVQND